MKIVYFGTPEFAVPSLTRLIDSPHHVVAVVSQPDRPRGRGHRTQVTPTKAVAQARGIPVLQPERVKDPQFLAQLSSYEPDLGVVAAYGRILPDALLAVPRLGMINVHGSILPAYRGAAPVHRAVIAGDSETGVTIMRVISELDAGPTFATRRRAIGPDETSADVERALADLGADVLVEVVDSIAAGRAEETPQDDSRATFAPKLAKTEGRIDWSQPASVIHNLVRGLHPWPLASARLGASRLVVRKTDLKKVAGSVSLGAAAPGTIVSATPDGLDILCGDGNLIRITEIQPEGKRAMPVRDFLAGHTIPPGARLEVP